MKEAWKKSKGNNIILALLYIALGVFMVMRSEDVGILVCYVLAAVLLVCGVLQIFTGFHKKSLGMFYSVHLILGILFLCLAAVVALRPTTFLLIISWIFGGMLLISSIIDFQFASEMKKFNYKGWWVTFIIALAMAVMGVLMFIYDSEALPFTYVGIFLIIDGASDLWIIFALSGAVRKFNKAAEAAASQETVDDELTDISGDIIDAQEGADFYDAGAGNTVSNETANNTGNGTVGTTGTGERPSDVSGTKQ